MEHDHSNLDGRPPHPEAKERDGKWYMPFHLLGGVYFDPETGPLKNFNNVFPNKNIGQRYHFPDTPLSLPEQWTWPWLK
jgi:hypothetical protein